MLIAFYDKIRSLKIFGGGVEFAEERISKFADDALERIEMEVEIHRCTIMQLTEKASQQAERLKLLSSGEPANVFVDGRLRPVMVYTNDCGERYAEYTDEEGKRTRMDFE